MTLRSQYLYGGLSFSCFLFLAYAFYAQYVQHFEPCPLCYFQRIVIALLSITWLINMLVRCLPALQLSMQLCLCTLGNILAGRHLWIQMHPDVAKGSCGMGIQYMIDSYPFLEVILKSWKGTVDCADASWRMLHLTAPAWLIIIFTGMTIISLFAYALRTPSSVTSTATPSL
jgi:protein dithiol:quinone oxidoreductase